ncbi:MAG: GFA family protein [Pseudomonadota bacterium]
MELTGGCYCGAMRYKATGKPRLKAQCHCRECQYFSGGGPNYFMLMPGDGFRYTSGEPRTFTRTDLADPVTREFCDSCGGHILTRRSDMTEVVLKVGTLDDPAAFKAPAIAIFTVDQQPFHLIPEGMPCFETLPKR